MTHCVLSHIQPCRRTVIEEEPGANTPRRSFWGIRMPSIRLLLLSCAAGLAVAPAASAADLGARKPSPVEYVRSCYNPLWGASGGFVIPGTQTCLRVFGQARFDYAFEEQINRVGGPTGFRAGSFLGVDSITPSEFGNVRAFAQIGMTYRSGAGNQRSGSQTRRGTFIDGFAGAFGGNAAATSLAQAGTEVGFAGFIQFAGITAGRTASFFDPFFTPEIIGVTFRSTPGNVNLIAYTAALGNGVTATISVEDPTIRRDPVIATSGLGAGVVGTGAIGATFGSQVGLGVPHIVGALQVDQPWGSAKVAGVLTNVRPAFTIGGAGSTFVVPGVPATVSRIPDTKYGFAVQGAVKINMPFLAPGDNVVVTGAYGEGAVSYVVSNAYQTSESSSAQNVRGVQINVGDAAVDVATGRFRLTKGWSVSAGFQHFWMPTLSSTVFGSYASYDTPFDPANIRDLNRDFTAWSVGANTIWQPVRGLNIAAEGSYIVFNTSGRVYDINRNANFAGTALVACSNFVGNCRTLSSDGRFFGRLRVTRDF
jgi:hypothetical protein